MIRIYIQIYLIKHLQKLNLKNNNFIKTVIIHLYKTHMLKITKVEHIIQLRCFVRDTKKRS